MNILNRHKIEALTSNVPRKAHPDKDADRSGTDKDADKTEIGKKDGDKYDKPKRETDPDRTGIDKDSDKTKK